MSNLSRIAGNPHARWHISPVPAGEEQAGDIEVDGRYYRKHGRGDVSKWSIEIPGATGAGEAENRIPGILRTAKNMLRATQDRTVIYWSDRDNRWIERFPEDVPYAVVARLPDSERRYMDRLLENEREMEWIESEYERAMERAE
jgi:hypothetical protein